MIGLALDLLKIKAIAHKELLWYFNNPTGAIIIALFAGFGNFLFFRNFFLNNDASLRPYFALLPWLLIFLTAAISARLFAEEKRGGTLEVLMSLPINEWELILGKFAASLLFFLSCLLSSITLPLTLFFLGRPDLGPITVGYLGSLLLAAAMFSVALFLSALSKNQVVSSLSTILVLFLINLAGDEFLLQQLPAAVTGPVAFLGFTQHSANFPRGVVDLRDLIFFLTTTVAFLFLTVKMIEKRE